MPDPSWQWNSTDGQTGGLLYEPGNWGDLLKAEWVWILAEWFIEQKLPLHYVDVFAGAARYSMASATRARLQQIPECGIARQIDASSPDATWPSAATLVKNAWRGKNPCLQVFELDPERRRTYDNTECVEVLETASGGDLLTGCLIQEPGLLLVDPYDFLKDWPSVLPNVLAAARKMHVLVYLYNRSGRSEKHLRRYRNFRNRLDEARPLGERLIGRVPADGFLPNAHHEMLYLPPAGEAIPEGLIKSLRESTLYLDCVIHRYGIFEG